MEALAKLMRAASVARLEADSRRAQGYRYGLLEDLDRLYRYSALLDRLEGQDVNSIIRACTDIIPSRLTIVHHRAPEHAGCQRPRVQPRCMR